MYLLYTAGISTLCCAVGAVLTVNNKMYTMQGKYCLGVHADTYWIWVVDLCVRADLLRMRAYALHVDAD